MMSQADNSKSEQPGWHWDYVSMVRDLKAGTYNPNDAEKYRIKVK